MISLSQFKAFHASASGRKFRYVPSRSLAKQSGRGRLWLTCPKDLRAHKNWTLPLSSRVSLGGILCANSRMHASLDVPFGFAASHLENEGLPGFRPCSVQMSAICCSLSVHGINQLSILSTKHKHQQMIGV